MNVDIEPPKQRSGPKSHRVLLYVAAALLTFLLLWFWSFVLRDISAVTMPQWEHVDKSKAIQGLNKQLDGLTSQQGAVSQTISDLEQSQRLLRDSTNSTRDTMNQLLENQKQLTEKNIPLSPSEQESIAQSQKLFLDNQNKYQLLNQELVTQNAEKVRVTHEISAVRKQLEPLEKNSRERYARSLEKARMKAAALQLGLLMPLFLLAFWLIINKRNSSYGILIYPFGISLFLKMMGVVHEYFPSRYFKYIALLGLIAAVVALMMYLLRMIARPKPDFVLKQIREAYDKQACAQCAYPIQRGWLKRAGLQGIQASRLIAIPTAIENQKLEPYSCPSCGERLYEKCEKCDHVRHSLLPYCEYCGERKSESTHESAIMPPAAPDVL